MKIYPAEPFTRGVEMGIYDRDYYKERKKEKCFTKKLFKLAWFLIVFLFLFAFVIYLLALFSEK